MLELLHYIFVILQEREKHLKQLLMHLTMLTTVTILDQRNNTVEIVSRPTLLIRSLILWEDKEIKSNEMKHRTNHSVLA